MRFDDSTLLSEAKRVLYLAETAGHPEPCNLRAILKNGSAVRVVFYNTVRDLPLKFWDRKTDRYVYLYSVRRAKKGEW